MYFHKGENIVNSHGKNNTLALVYLFEEKRTSDYYFIIMKIEVLKKAWKLCGQFNSDCDILRYMYMRTYMLFDIVFIYIHVIKST